ncbi:Luciferin 4-monooxygenase [Gryllus bimaculatus]|nr:Luciferin 4-monooxygenase [Gryllus bimaculatus]
MVQRALSVAAELRRRGIGKGDVVLTAFDNCLEYTYVFLGTMYIGAIFAPINPGLAPGDLQHMLRVLEPRLALLDSLTKLERPPVHVLVSPGFWSSGFFSTLISLHVNITQILLRGFDVETLLRTVEKYKANILALSPFQIVAIAKHPSVEKYDLSSLLFISYAGAPLSLVMKVKAEQRLHKPLAQYYGLTECLFTVVPGPKNPLKPGTVVDVETGKTNGPNTEGEICFKGPNVFKGYYRNPEATATVIDSEGWMHSGDIGFFDDDGYFFVHDRIKELIKQKGIQVIPTDIESVLLSHVAVKDTAVVGIEHDLEQEQAVAFVVKQPGAAVTEEELINLVKEQLPEYKWLNGGVRFTDAIPRTASGKVIRRELRQRARDLQSPPSPTQGSVRKMCQVFENLSNQSLKDIKRSSHRSVL